MTMPLGGVDNFVPYLDDTYAAAANLLEQQNFVRQLDEQAKQLQEIANEPLHNLQQNLSRTPGVDAFTQYDPPSATPYLPHTGDHFYNGHQSSAEYQPPYYNSLLNDPAPPKSLLEQQAELFEQTEASHRPPFDPSEHHPPFQGHP
jgi:hypothetical protein